MKITLERIDDNVQFEATNDRGNTVVMDGASSIGGNEAGMSPMQLLLSAVAGCASFDVSLILKKQKQDIKNLKVEATGERPETGYAKPFTSIHLHFIVSGTPDDSKVKRAIELSVEKYCSVATSLDPNIKLSYDHEIKA